MFLGPSPRPPKPSYFTLSGAPGPSGARPGPSQAPQLAPKNLVFYSVWASLAPRSPPRGPTVALQGPAAAPRSPQQPRRAPAGPHSSPGGSQNPRVLQRLGPPWPRGPPPDPKKTSYFTVSRAPGPSGARLGASQAPRLALKNLVFYSAWAARRPREHSAGAHRGPAGPRGSPMGPAAAP